MIFPNLHTLFAMKGGYVMARKPKHDDDGRTIANMNVDGMPWYVKRSKPSPDNPDEKIELSPQETRAFMGGVLKAGLLLALVFAVVFGLFIALCDFVIFK